MEIGPSRGLGTYHVIDGQKVTIKYAGQMQTCARCHQTARICKGKGVAKRCEENNGEKVDFVQYIISLWKDIGYAPKEAKLNEDELSDEEVSSIVEQEGGQFTPAKVVESDPSLYNGVSIKGFSATTDKSDIIELLVESGLPFDKMDEILFKSNGSIVVQNISTSVCKSLIDTLHSSYQLERKIHCNGIIPFTPVKTTSSIVDNDPSPVPEILLNNEPVQLLTNGRGPSPKVLTKLGTNTDISKYVEDNEKQLNDQDNLILKQSLSTSSPLPLSEENVMPKSLMVLVEWIWLFSGFRYL